MTFEVLAHGLAFPEGPRWHDGALWFSDMYAGEVLRLVPGEAPQRVVSVPECPSGLGFLPDGRLLVVSMHDRRVLRLNGPAVVHLNGHLNRRFHAHIGARWRP